MAKSSMKQVLSKSLLAGVITFSAIPFTTVTFNTDTVAASTISAPLYDVTEKSIKELQQSLARGEITSEQLVKLYIDRIKVLDPQFKSIIALNPDAYKDAQDLDLERSIGEVRGPLHGIPIIVKDNYDLEGMPTTAGTTALAESYPVDNSTMVQQLIDAGAIIIAKANLSELAWSGYNSISSQVGETLNVYDPTRSSYGSSGGTGVAISASFAAAGLGTDTGSSIRNPSSVSALVGLRPTIGLSSRDGIVPLVLDRDTGGPMTRTVEDLAIMMNYLIGVDPKDTVTSKQIGKTPEDYTEYLDKDFLKGKKIGVIKQIVYPTDAEKTRSPHVDSNDPEIVAKFEEALKDFEEAGAEIVMVDFPEMFDLLDATGGGPTQIPYDIDQYLSTIGPDAPIKSFAELVEDGGYLDNGPAASYKDTDAKLDPKTSTEIYKDGMTYKEAYEKSEVARVAYRNATEAVMDEYSVSALIYPSLLVKPRLIEDTKSRYGSASNLIAPTTGLPAMNVPMGYLTDNEGDLLSLGLQMLGHEFEEATLIGASYAYEQQSKNRVTSDYLRPTTDIAPFTDVNEHWAAQYISDVINEKIFNGTTDTTFSPERVVTRGMFISVLARLENIQSKDTTTKFKDVSKTAYYSAYVKWATESSLIQGFSDGTFKPNTPLTRNQAALILNRYLDFKGITVSEPGSIEKFTDIVKLTNESKAAIANVQALEIMSGNSESTFGPQQQLTRGQAAKMLSILNDIVEE